MDSSLLEVRHEVLFFNPSGFVTLKLICWIFALGLKAYKTPEQAHQAVPKFDYVICELFVGRKYLYCC